MLSIQLWDFYARDLDHLARFGGFSTRTKHFQLLFRLFGILSFSTPSPLFSHLTPICFLKQQHHPLPLLSWLSPTNPAPLPIEWSTPNPIVPWHSSNRWPSIHQIYILFVPSANQLPHHCFETDPKQNNLVHPKHLALQSKYTKASPFPLPPKQFSSPKQFPCPCHWSERWGLAP